MKDDETRKEHIRKIKTEFRKLVNLAIKEKRKYQMPNVGIEKQLYQLENDEYDAQLYNVIAAFNDAANGEPGEIVEYFNPILGKGYFSLPNPRPRFHGKKNPWGAVCTADVLFHLGESEGLINDLPSRLGWDAFNKDAKEWIRSFLMCDFPHHSEYSKTLNTALKDAKGILWLMLTPDIENLEKGIILPKTFRKGVINRIDNERDILIERFDD